MFIGALIQSLISICEFVRLIFFVFVNRDTKVGQGRRAMNCYFRMSGVMMTMLDVKSSASEQMRHAFTACLSSDSEIAQPEILLDWHAFTTFENLNVAHSDFFIIYCRTTPIEFCSFTPRVNLLEQEFPAEIRPLGQQYSCVRFAKIDMSNQAQILSRPKYIQELGVFGEILGTSFSLSDCIRFLLTDTAEGVKLRRDRVPKPLPQEVHTLPVASKVNSWDLLSSRKGQRRKLPSMRTSGGGTGGGGGDKSPMSKRGMALSSRSTNEVESDSDDSSVGEEDVVQSEATNLCVVPLFQWVAMTDDTFASMTLAAMMFTALSKESALSVSLPFAKKVGNSDEEAHTTGVSMPLEQAKICVNKAFKEAGLKAGSELETQKVFSNHTNFASKTAGVKVCAQTKLHFSL